MSYKADLRNASRECPCLAREGEADVRECGQHQCGRVWVPKGIKTQNKLRSRRCLIRVPFP